MGILAVGLCGGDWDMGIEPQPIPDNYVQEDIKKKVEENAKFMALDFSTLKEKYISFDIKLQQAKCASGASLNKIILYCEGAEKYMGDYYYLCDILDYKEVDYLPSELNLSGTSIKDDRRTNFRKSDAYMEGLVENLKSMLV